MYTRKRMKTPDDHDRLHQKADRFSLPWDLSEWVEPGRLLAWINEDLDQLDWDNPRLVAYQREHPDYQPRLKLTLLTLAYALGIFDIEEIGECRGRNDLLRTLCRRGAPAIHAMRRFRRENRGLLKRCLVELLKRVVRSRYELGDTLLPRGLISVLEDMAVMRLDLARQMDHE
jgi:transposase